MATLSFSASDPTVQLAGGVILGQGLASDGEYVAVVGNQSTQIDGLPAGAYKYEFNILTGGKFTLKVSVNGTQVQSAPGEFDPSASKIDRIVLFTLT